LGRPERSVGRPSRDSGDNSALLEHFVHTKTNEQEEVRDWPEKEELQLVRGYVAKGVIHWMPFNDFPENGTTQIKTSPKIEDERQIAKNTRLE
jgi:hypothetical protein